MAVLQPMKKERPTSPKTWAVLVKYPVGYEYKNKNHHKGYTILDKYASEFEAKESAQRFRIRWQNLAKAYDVEAHVADLSKDEP